VKLNQIILQKKKVISRLRNNITMMAKDPDIKAEIAREILFREKSRQISSLQKELHRVRESDRKLLQTLLTYKLKEQNERQGMQDAD
jgi:predicted RNase H-like nuclease (RuvC/YqgF family)